MISPLPWEIDENDPSIIYDANGEVIAKDYKFFHVDDFESIRKKDGYNKKEVNEIMLDLWIQFSDFSPTSEGEPHRWAYGLSALESLESFLHENRLIDKHGIPK